MLDFENDTYVYDTQDTNIVADENVTGVSDTTDGTATQVTEVL